MIRQLHIAATILSLAALVGRVSLAQFDPPAGYYSTATGTGATLKGQLLTIMSTGHIQRTYGNFRDSAAITDAHPTMPGQIWLVYDRAIVPATWTNGATWDREHVWPQSLQGGSPNVNNDDTGHRADPHALRPSTPIVNSTRGNKPFGLLTDSGSHGPADDDSAYYYPGDADAGDVARSLFYSATRWSSLGLTLVNDNPGGFQMGDLASLIKYNFQDPPDTFERRRNHTIYSQADNPLYYTNNRNAYVDRPEYVWSVYVDQANDSRITINGTTPDANGGSTRNVDLGRVFTGSVVPSAQVFTLDKAGTDGTYFEVTSTGAATSSIAGRYNAFRTNQTDSKSITVGLITNTSTAGLRSGSVIVNNLDVTTSGGTGRGANDANDSFNVSLTVLDHATASFESATTALTKTLDFGTLTTASDPLSLFFDVFNRNTTVGFTANMDFDSIIGSGDTSVLTTNAGPQAGSLVLAGGAGQMFSTTIDTSAVGSFSATYTLNFSDENIAGAQADVLTLDLSGQVLLAGDFNRDYTVDTADYLVWQKTYGQSVAAAYDWGDGDGDSFVDEDDLIVWQEHFGETAGGGGGLAPASVPEPSCIFLMMIGIGIFGGIRQRI